MLLSTLVIATSLSVVVAARPAGANQVGDLESQAKAITQELVQEQLQADAYQQQYSVASAKVAADQSAIVETDQQIGTDQQQIAGATLAVRQLVINSYMTAGAGLTHSDTEFFSGDEEAAQVADEYAGIAAGNIEGALDQLHGDQHALQTRQAELEQQQVQDQSTQRQEATYLSQADATDAQLESVQSQVAGRLAAAVAGQAAAQAKAATAAVAAARRSAVSATASHGGSGAGSSTVPNPGSSTVPGTGVGASTVTVTDPALNPFLECVVQAESGGNYRAVSPSGEYMGAFQFSQSTWNMAARAAGLPGLVGVRPNRASKAEQDTLAVALYALDGERPWLGDRCSG